MPLVNPDDVEESDVETLEYRDVTVEYDGEEMTVGEAVGRIEENTDGLSDWLASVGENVATLTERVEELEAKTERQSAVIHELVDMVELLGGAVDHNDLYAAREARGEHGSDIYPWDWESETMDFKSRRYE